MTDLDVLQRLQEFFGGSIYATARAKPHHKEAWRWQVSGTTAVEIMELVKPYMLSRRRSAIDKILTDWYEMEAKARLRLRQSTAAARAYLADDSLSLREAARRFNVSHEAVRQAVFREQ